MRARKSASESGVREMPTLEGQAVERGHEFAAREVAIGSEDHHSGGRGGAVEAQRIV
jgi:hypothetical protein